MQTIRVGIIGYGNIGKKRFKALKNINNFKIKIVYIVDNKEPKYFHSKVFFLNNWKKIKDIKVDLIIISTPTKNSESMIKYLSGKFNLLVEKPITTKINLIKKIVARSNAKGKLLKVGYNLRFDDGVIFIKNILSQGKIGKIYYCKIAYANGTSKSNTNNVGSLMDMGSHSINLLEYFFKSKKIKIIKSLSQRNEFMNKSKIDNGFIMLKINKIICLVHHSFCRWKNIFNLEIVGSKGYLIIDSLPKWGQQKISLGIRKYPSGTPKIKNWYFKHDNSWKNELYFVLKKISENNHNKFKKINIESQNTLYLINNINKK